MKNIFSITLRFIEKIGMEPDFLGALPTGTIFMWKILVRIYWPEKCIPPKNIKEGRNRLKILPK